MTGRLTAHGSYAKEGKLVPQSYESKMHDHNTLASRREENWIWNKRWTSQMKVECTQYDHNMQA